jgi:hypothetical protein
MELIGEHMAEHITYADAGVDVDEGARAVDAIKDAVASTNRPEVIGGLGGFGSCFSALALKDMDDPVLVSGTDGVGTKLAIAQLLDRHDTVGKDLVAMCADDVVVVGAEPLFFLDYVAVGKLQAEAMEQIENDDWDTFVVDFYTEGVSSSDFIKCANNYPGSILVAINMAPLTLPDERDPAKTELLRRLFDMEKPTVQLHG